VFSIGTGDPNSVVNFRGDDQAPGFSDSSFTYNFAPPNAMSLPVNRWNLSGFANLDLSEHANAYVQAFFTTYDTQTQLAPVPATGISIPVTNPHISADLRTLLDSRPDPTADFSFRQRMEGVRPRQSKNEFNVYQLLAGVRGDVGESWNWNIYASSASVSGTEVLNNDVSLTRLEELVDSPTGGTDVCAGGYNPFGGPAGLSPECVDYVRSYFTNRTSLDHKLAEATFGGKAFSMPAGEAQFSVGVSWRDEQYNFTPDSAIARGDSSGFNRQHSLEGSFNMKGAVRRLHLPVLDGARFAKTWVHARRTRLRTTLSPASPIPTSWKARGSRSSRCVFEARTSARCARRHFELFHGPASGASRCTRTPCSATSAVRNVGANADVAHG
jgi:hypothetical protein